MNDLTSIKVKIIEQVILNKEVLLIYKCVHFETGFILKLKSLFLKFQLLGSPAETEMSKINIIYKNSLPFGIFYFIHFLTN